MVADKKAGEGYLIHDISFMNSGNFYLSALSIPYVGRKIAQHNQKDFDSFWKTNYAELLGESAVLTSNKKLALKMENRFNPTGLIRLGVDLSSVQTIDNNPQFNLFMASDIIKYKLKLYRVSSIEMNKQRQLRLK